MDYHNMQQREGIFSEDLNKFNGGMEFQRIDPYTLQQIEYYLQQQVNNNYFINLVWSLCASHNF
jgi:hypothetical protein